MGFVFGVEGVIGTAPFHYYRFEWDDGGDGRVVENPPERFLGAVSTGGVGIEDGADFFGEGDSGFERDAGEGFSDIEQAPIGIEVAVIPF